jgi:hypothetical protein
MLTCCTRCCGLTSWSCAVFFSACPVFTLVVLVLLPSAASSIIEIPFSRCQRLLEKNVLGQPKHERQGPESQSKSCGSNCEQSNCEQSSPHRRRAAGLRLRFTLAQSFTGLERLGGQTLCRYRCQEDASRILFLLFCEGWKLGVGCLWRVCHHATGVILIIIQPRGA